MLLKGSVMIPSASLSQIFAYEAFVENGLEKKKLILGWTSAAMTHTVETCEQLNLESFYGFMT